MESPMLCDEDIRLSFVSSRKLSPSAESRISNFSLRWGFVRLPWQDACKAANFNVWPLYLLYVVCMVLSCAVSYVIHGPAVDCACLRHCLQISMHCLLVLQTCDSLDCGICWNRPYIYNIVAEHSFAEFVGLSGVCLYHGYWKHLLLLPYQPANQLLSQLWFGDAFKKGKKQEGPKARQRRHYRLWHPECIKFLSVWAVRKEIQKAAEFPFFGLTCEGL